MEEGQAKLLRRIALLVALIGILPVGHLTIFVVSSEVQRLLDSCFSFGDERPIQLSAKCPRVTSIGQTRQGAITNLIALQGTALGGAILGVIGIYC